jgi:hypothetical protein
MSLPKQIIQHSIQRHKINLANGIEIAKTFEGLCLSNSFQDSGFVGESVAVLTNRAIAEEQRLTPAREKPDSA